MDDVDIGGYIKEGERRGKGGREPFVLRNRYHTLLPTAVQNLQRELIRKIEQRLRLNKPDLIVFKSELGLFVGDDENSRMGNDKRKYTVVIPNREVKVYYVALKPATITEYMCPFLRHVRNEYIGFTYVNDRDTVVFKLFNAEQMKNAGRTCNAIKYETTLTAV